MMNPNENQNHFDYFVYPIQIGKVTSTDRVALIDGDGSNGVDNLALMKISAFEKRRGVSNVRLVKLKHKRSKSGEIGLSENSLKELVELKQYTRVYASFIFTRSKPILEIVRQMLPDAVIGGTGADAYYPKEEGDQRAKPKSITQLDPMIEEMYPDFSLYESPDANANIRFWSDPSSRVMSRIAKKELQDIRGWHGIRPLDLVGNKGASFGEFENEDVVRLYDEMASLNGMADGKVWRGSTRGMGYSSKGCHRRCTFCVVPVIQGHITPMYYGLLGVVNWVLPIGFYPTMEEIVLLHRAGRLLMRPHLFRDSDGKVTRISAFLTISDNNFIADPTCIEKLLWIQVNSIAINLNQGMDARLLTVKKRVDKDGFVHPSGDEICEKLSRIYFTNFNGTARQLHFSWDFMGVERAVFAGLTKLVEEYGLSYRNFTVYALSGFNTTFEQDYERVMKLRKLRIDPFVMLFRNVDGSEGTMADGTPQDWRLKHLTRWVNRKHIFWKTPFEEFEDYKQELAEREAGHVVDFNRLEELKVHDEMTELYVQYA